MTFPCWSENCKKQFSTKFNRNKHERIKKHYQADERLTHNISYNEQTKSCSCPTTNCTATSRYKHNIIKHLKSCYIVNKNKKAASEDKICSICSKSFLKKSNRDRHINTVHARDSDVVPSLIDDNIEDGDLPSMALDGTELPTPEDTTFMETESLARQILCTKMLTQYLFLKSLIQTHQ